MKLNVQLHSHTTESKGTRIVVESTIKPKKLIDISKKNNINAIAITDHNVTSAIPKIKQYAKKNNIILIKGVEIDTDSGHLIGLGIDLGIQEKLKMYMPIFEAVDLIKTYGGEVYIPHPFDIRNKGIGVKIKQIDGIVEVFNSLNIFKFEDRYAGIVASKLKKPKAVGADAHIEWMLPLCITVVDSEPEEYAILKTIKKGKTTFKNCKHLTLKQMKELSLERVTRSYDHIKNEIKNSWEVDMGYMHLANFPLMKPFELPTLKFGTKTKKTFIWDFVIYISYVLATIYSKRSKKKFKEFIFSL